MLITELEEDEEDEDGERTISDSDDSTSTQSIGHSSLSPSEPWSHLRKLCVLLEGRVNRHLIPVEPADNNKSGSYPRLSRLVDYLQYLPLSVGIDLIPCVGSAPGRFLLNITEDVMTAEAFVTFANPALQPPRRETRRQMITDVKNLKNDLVSFNSFVDRLQFSVASLDSIATPLSSPYVPGQSFPVFDLLQRFREQTAAAYGAIMSHVRDCEHTKSTEHRILLQLPGWGEIAQYGAQTATENLPIHLFLTVCPQSDWQLAKMSFLL